MANRTRYTFNYAKPVSVAKLVKQHREAIACLNQVAVAYREFDKATKDLPIEEQVSGPCWDRFLDLRRQMLPHAQELIEAVSENMAKCRGDYRCDAYYRAFTKRVGIDFWPLGEMPNS